MTALRANGGLRAGVSLRRAVDVFHVLTSAGLFHQITVGRRWPLTQAKRLANPVTRPHAHDEPRRRRDTERGGSGAGAAETEALSSGTSVQEL